MTSSTSMLLLPEGYCL